ncbi:aldose epimerase family protein [uncultured Jannaschia sp.]|uniref:aldose epimerase family protein n=1 Tax=uncultured Jannaschia sp. TaxID=293347 RepID=UPI00262E48C9|nr:aldose epimerase family protein [uncultured Jannaschia sp.]
MSRPAYTIRGHGLTATFTDLGAVLHDLRLDGIDHPLVLGLADLDHYPEFSNYMGATAGRVANRIGGARFELDGATHRTDPNFKERHTLHGGSAGIGKRIWDVAQHGDDAITFAIDLADGEMGFPGAMRIEARYVCAPDAALRVEYRATCDAPTLCNLAHHTYWNLDGAATVADHVLTVAADRYVPVDDDLIPTGIAPVDGTAFDFRRGRALPAEGLLDHNLCLSDERVALREVAWLRTGGLEMAVATTEPGLQVYDGAKLNTQVPGLEGRVYRAHAGVALEPQVWPDAPNQAGFPSAVLRPGETYEQITEFRFSRR